MKQYFLSFRFVIIFWYNFQIGCSIIQIFLLQESNLRVIPEFTAKAILPLSDKWK